jgi:hypothetical protein
MVLAVGREIVVYPELLQVMPECGLFRGIEATEHELYWAGILGEEFGGTSGASLQLPPNGLANAPKSSAIQGARMESFIWSMLRSCVIIAFSNSYPNRGRCRPLLDVTKRSS